MRTITIKSRIGTCARNCLLATALLLSGNAAANDAVLKVVLLPYPGYSEYDEQGRVVGHAVDVLTRLFERAGRDFDITLLPIARVRRGLVSGELDVWLGLNNQVGLEAYTVQGRSSFGRLPVHLYYRQGEPVPVWPDSLHKRSLILITNYNYSLPISRVLQDDRLDVEKRSSSSHVGAIRMLLRGRGDYLLDYRGQAAAAMAELGLEYLPHIVVEEPPMRLFISRRRADAAALMDDLDLAFESLVREGVDMDVTRQ